MSQTWVDAIAVVVAGLPGIIAAVYAARIHGQVKTPSGDTLGNVAERTHDLTSADLALTTQIHDTVTNGHHEQEA